MHSQSKVSIAYSPHSLEAKVRALNPRVLGYASLSQCRIASTSQACHDVVLFLSLSKPLLSRLLLLSSHSSAKLNLPVNPYLVIYPIRVPSFFRDLFGMAWEKAPRLFTSLPQRSAATGQVAEHPLPHSDYHLSNLRIRIGQEPQGS